MSCKPWWSYEAGHHRTIVRIGAAARVVVQVLLGAVVDAGNAARGEHERHRLVQTVVVIVDGKKARHVVIVDKGDEVFFPGEVACFLREDGIDLGEVCV